MARPIVLLKPFLYSTLNEILFKIGMEKTIGQLCKVIITTLVQATMCLVDPEKNNEVHHDTNLQIDFVKS